jgi:putative flippase GtrA
MAVAHGLLKRLDPAFVRFAVVGVIGFVVDFSILSILTLSLKVDKFLAQAVAFPIAVGATWLLNRVWTFAGATGKPLARAAAYFGVQCAGFATNYVVYATVLFVFPALSPHWLVIPLALGAVAALCITFAGSKHLAFRGRREPTPREPAAVADTPAA